MTKGKIITIPLSPLVPVGFDCSTIHEKGIDRMENFRAGAIMIVCGEVTAAQTSASSTWVPVRSPACPKSYDAPGIRCCGRKSDHRYRDLSQHDAVGDIHYGQPR